MRLGGECMDEKNAIEEMKQLEDEMKEEEELSLHEKNINRLSLIALLLDD